MAYQQAGIAVENEQAFGSVKAAIDAVFTPQAVSRFLSRLGKRKLRVREFEAILAQGAFESPQAAASYAGLSASDQGQIREYYLAKLEQVEPSVREKFLKLYAYY